MNETPTAVGDGTSARSPAEQPQRVRDAHFGRQHRMTRGEHEPQQNVADVVVWVAHGLCSLS